MTRRAPFDEDELRAQFAEIDAPSTLDRWRDRVAEDPDPPEDDAGPGVVVSLTPDRVPHEVRRPKVRALAVAAAGIAVVVGLGGVVVANRLLTDEPPAKPPPTVIDGPDRSAAPSRGDESASRTAPPSSGSRAPVRGGRPEPTSGGGPEGDGGGGRPVPGNPTAAPPAGESPPPPMVGHPTPANAGVPVDTTLRAHNGDLRVTTPGAVITNLRVTGMVIVEAPDVTLRRVAVAGRGGQALRQAAGAARLTVELSDLAGGIVQEAAGLTLRRCTTGQLTARDGLTAVDTYFSGPLQVSAGSTRIVARRNTVGRVVLDDLVGPITDVTVEDSDLGRVIAPAEAGSRDIRVRRNVFRENPPSTGWNEQGPGFEWTGNTSRASGAPIGP